MRVVVDSGPLIYLSVVSQFALLRRYCSEVLVPEAVFQEVVVAGQGQPGSRDTETAVQVGWLSRAPRPEPGQVSSWRRKGLSATDAAVLALATEHPSHALLTDDLAVRTVAHEAGLQAYGTLGLLIDGKRDGHLSHLQPLLDQLIACGFYLDPRPPVPERPAAGR